LAENLEENTIPIKEKRLNKNAEEQAELRTTIY